MSAFACEKEKNTTDYHLVFKGDVSLRGGGFCGVRSKFADPPFDLSSFNGIYFKTKSMENYQY